MPIFSLTDFNFWFGFIHYFIAVLVAYYLPGSLILRSVSLPIVFHTAVSIILGMVLFAFQGFIFGYLGVRYLTYVYLIITGLTWLIMQKRTFGPKVKPQYHFQMLSVILIVIGSLAQLTTIWFTGLSIKDGAYYCCGNANDNFFYGAISQQIVHRFPPHHPGMSGTTLTNYHYWSNLIIGETARIFKLPVFQLQFQYSSVLLSILSGVLILGVVYVIGGKKSLGSWILFFFYFGSDAVYWIIVFLRSGPVFSMSSLEDGIGYLANYPRAMAVLVSFAAMNLLFLTRKKPAPIRIISTAILLASLTGIKIYTAFFIYSGLLFLTIYDLLIQRIRTTLIISAITLSLVIPIYLSANSQAGGLYFMGFWRAQNFIVQPWLNLLRLEQARLIFEADQKWLQVTAYNLLFTLIYVVSIFGTKIIGLFNIRPSYRQLPVAFHIFFIPALLVSFVVGFFFNQDTGESNTFNFLVSVFIYLSFYSALLIAYLQQKFTKIGLLIVFALIIFTLPRPLYRTFRNLAEIIQLQSYSVPAVLLEGAEKIRQKTTINEVFLVNFRKFKFDREGPVFNMLTDRPMYYSGEGLITWFKPDAAVTNKHLVVAEMILNASDSATVSDLLSESGISYIIDSWDMPIPTATDSSLFQIFFENRGIRILKVINKRPF
jgi:hypothetical protein